MKILCLKSNVKKLRRNIRDYGIIVSFQKFLCSAFSPLFEIQTYLLYVVDLVKAAGDGRPANGDFVFRFIDPTEDALIAQIENMEDWLQGKLKSKLEDGQKCLVALHNNSTVAGFNLVCYTVFRIPLIKLNKPLRPFECFSEQITIHPRFRKKGLGTNLRHAVFNAMKNEGYHRMYGGTHISNFANKSLTSKVGFKIFAKVSYVSVFGFSRVLISRRRK